MNTCSITHSYNINKGVVMPKEVKFMLNPHIVVLFKVAKVIDPGWEALEGLGYELHDNDEYLPIREAVLEAQRAMTALGIVSSQVVKDLGNRQ